MSDHPTITLDEAVLGPLRAICRTFPEAVQAEAFGTPTFQVRSKNFAMTSVLDGRVSVWCKGEPGAQEAYVASEPDRYFRPPYLGGNGWIGCWLDGDAPPDWDEIEAIVETSYRLVAPKRLVARLDEDDRPEAVPGSTGERAGSTVAGDVLERIRTCCLALPETTERLSHGAPSFFVRDKKTFVMFLDNHHDDGRLAIWCHAADGVQGLLVAQDPERFFVPPYVGHRGWLGVRLDRGIDWDQIDDLIEDAWRMAAPKRLIAQLEDGSAGG